MAKAKRKPFDPLLDAKRKERQRAAEDAQMRAQGIDPHTARWGDEALTPDRIEALVRQGFQIVRADSAEAKDAGVSTVAVDHRGRQVKASHKADIWQQLFTRGALNRDQLNAVRDLQDLMAKRAGVGGRDEAMAYKRDKTDAPSDPCLVSDLMLEAGREMDLTLQLVGPPSQRLLTGLLWPVVMSEPETMQKPMRRCSATAEQKLAFPKKALRDHAGRAVGRQTIERRVCETLNAVDAKHCSACGEAMPADVVKDGVVVARPGVEMMTVEADWREIVQRVAPWAKNPMAQSALLVNAAQALLDVRPQVAKAMKERKDARREATRANAERYDPQALSL